VRTDQLATFIQASYSNKGTFLFSSGISSYGCVHRAVFELRKLSRIELTIAGTAAKQIKGVW
jgi:hypothetical protein